MSKSLAEALACIVLAAAALEFFAHRLLKNPKTLSGETPGRYGAFLAPVRFLIWYYAGFSALWLLALDGLALRFPWVYWALFEMKYLGCVIFVVWGIMRVGDTLGNRRRAEGDLANRFDDFVLPLLGKTLRLVVPILALFLVIRVHPLDPKWNIAVGKFAAVALIVSVAWLIRSAVILSETVLLQKKQVSGVLDYEGRAVITRIRLLRKIALVGITIITFAAVLMLFEEARDFGRSILASAGVAGIIIGFAAQRSLGTLFAGLQIAFTQPIRIGDQVFVEGEFGTVEEITLTYVVIGIWDLRRLILPISYFIEKPIQNWTRVSANLLTPVAIRCDFSLPIEEFRKYMEEVIKESPFWDKRTFVVQLTDSKHDSMELRILGSAADAASSFNLQCFLREKAIGFIQTNYPNSLPRVRFIEARTPEIKPAA